MTGPAWSPSRIPDVVGASLSAAVVAGSIQPSGISSAEAFGSGSVSVAAGVLGLVATRCSIPAGKFTGQAQDQMNRTFHFARDGISAIKLIWANFWGQSESPGATFTLKASVEYPAGTFNQVTFSGSVTGTTTGQLLISDTITLSTPIPNGAKFFVRSFSNNTGGFLGAGSAGNYMYVPGGDASVYTGATDQTMGGTVTDSGSASGTALYPAAILGITANRSVALIGDSRTVGANDTSNASGDLGEVARSIGPLYAYTNFATSGEQEINWAANHTGRVALAQYATDIICNGGINDLATGAKTPTQLEGYVLGMRSDLSTKRFYACTISPITFSSTAWTLADGSDQTNVPEPVSTNRLTYNTWVRSSGAGALTGYLEIANQLELGSNQKKWKADGTANHYTSDGVHASPFGNASISITLP